MVKLRQTIDVERLMVWAFRDQRADQVGGSVGPRVATRSNDGVARAMEIHELGCMVQGSGAGAVYVSSAMGGGVHPDADRVAMTVGGFKDIRRDLVATHGRAGTRPDWKPWGAYWRAGTMTQWYRPATPKRPARPVMDYDSNGNPLSCPIVIGDSVQNVAAAREFYGLWHDALAACVAALNAGEGLFDYVVSGPKVLRQPWTDPHVVDIARHYIRVKRGFPKMADLTEKTKFA